ncbi:MAG: hypothetical protein H5T40_02645 [Methanobacteriales archaeon]|nr:hypothetical protein [Methanobacteriales archaeon]
MPRKYNIDQIILRLLADHDLSRQDIAEKIRETLNRPVSDKSINEALMKLLEDRRIQVVDYDLSVYNDVKRIQSIKSDGIVFSLVKKDPFEIFMLFKRMESEDVVGAERAYKKLKALFKAKMVVAGIKDYTLFDRMIHEIFLLDPKNKEKIIRRLSWALSNEKGSLDEFKDLVNYFKVRDHY